MVLAPGAIILPALLLPPRRIGILVVVEIIVVLFVACAKINGVLPPENELIKRKFNYFEKKLTEKKNKKIRRKRQKMKK